MSRVFQNIKIGLDEDLEEKLEWLVPNYQAYRVLKESVDARRRHDPHLVYTVEVYAHGENVPDHKIILDKTDYKGEKPIIIGAGPAGLFAALRFVERGVPCVLLEQGSETKTRMQKIARYWRYGDLDARNNVGFGEGGAGLYSDGKLITRIKSPHIPYVMDRLVQFGAPEEIKYLANPHVGSDRIRRVIVKMRDYLVNNGCDLRFDTKVTGLLNQGREVIGVETDKNEQIKSNKVILATGHSAKDMFTHLKELGVFIEGKSFAMGLRVEHPQKIINEIQYRGAKEHPKLGAANYKLTYHRNKDNLGVYSFCMCPGGYVLSSATEAGTIVTNGMSNYNRNSPFANAAIVVTIDHNKSFGLDIWGGMKLRDALEQKAYDMAKAAGANREIPAQKLMDFLNKKNGEVLKSSSPSNVVPAPLHELMPKALYDGLCEGFMNYALKMPAFVSDQAQLHAIESRTSCPVRITRDPETLESLSHKGLYPVGEGAGYAGGITSAACDGIRVAERIMADAN